MFFLGADMSYTIGGISAEAVPPSLCKNFWIKNVFNFQRVPSHDVLITTLKSANLKISHYVPLRIVRQRVCMLTYRAQWRSTLQPEFAHRLCDY